MIAMANVVIIIITTITGMMIITVLLLSFEFIVAEIVGVYVVAA